MNKQQWLLPVRASILDGLDYAWEKLPYDGELNRRQCHDCEVTASEVLLISQRLIAGEEYIESGVFCGLQQFAVPEGPPNP